MSFRKKTALPLAIALAFGLFTGVANADDDNDGRERSRHSRPPSFTKAPENALYKQERSSCHFLYQPWLLPARSWQAIMDESDKHFGDKPALDAATTTEML